jgi:uncharacterized protein
MLTSTFLHIVGCGEKTERFLWGSGFRSWDDVLCGDVPAYIKAGVLESKARLEVLDHDYFRERIPKRHVWRAYDFFREHVGFLDIETTGLDPRQDIVTTVCLHTPGYTKSYVAGENIPELVDDLEGLKYLVTFNGARFDLPFLTRRLGVQFHQIHLDLLYPLRALGFRGGLKSIERQLGYARDTEGVVGLDAVRLWHAYRRDCEVEVAGQRVRGEDALDLLVRYNVDDTVGLERLADYAVEGMVKATFPF